MGVSFKISHTGKRYKPRACLRHELGDGDSPENPESKDFVPLEDASLKKPLDTHDETGVGNSNQSTDNEISFILNLHIDGYSIEFPEEVGRRSADASHLLHPYDRSSESFLSAVAAGRFPRDAVDEKHCKFVAGSIICEVLDFRKCAVDNVSDASPVVHKINLKISLEDVVKDIPLMSDNCWTYGDLMEVESQILKALQPKLLLDPTPQLDRLCRNSIPSNLCLSLRDMRRKRRQEPKVLQATVTENNGKKVCIEKSSDAVNHLVGDIGSHPGNVTGQHAPDNAIERSRSFSGDGNAMASVFPGDPVVNIAGSGGQEMVVSYSDNAMNGKRVSNEGRLSPMNKRATLSPNSEGIYQFQMDTSDMNWRNAQFQQRGMQFNQNAMQSSFPAGQTSMRYATEQLEAEKMSTQINQMRSDVVHFDPQQRLSSQNLMRSNISQTAWSNHSQDLRKEEQFQKRKSGQSPRLSSGALAQSPLSSKSGELSSGSGGPHFAAASALASQKEKSMGASDMIQRQPPPQVAKRRSNSFNKTQTINTVGSPASVSTNSQLNANSPSVSTHVTHDQSLMDRFMKIDLTMKRHKLLPTRNKADNYPIRKAHTYSPQMIPQYISNAPSCEDFVDESSSKKLSRTLIGGSMNTCKSRVVNFVMPGEMAQGKSRTRLILIEKPNDGTVAMFYGETEEDGTLPDEDHLPSLPNSDFADSLVAQLCSLMLRDGYVVEDDRVQAKLVNSPTSQGNVQMDRQQFGDTGAASIQPPNEMKQSFAAASQMNRMLPPGNPQAMLSGGSMTHLRPQLEQQAQQQPSSSQAHEYNQQFQRQRIVNSMPHLNALGQNSSVQLGGHMNTKATSLQMQILQQQQMQKQNQMQQRKLMVGLGTAMGMGNLTSNIVGLGAMSNAVGFGGVRGPITVGNLSQNALGQQVRTGQFSPQEVASYNQKIRMAVQSRPGMLAGQGTGRPMLGLRGNVNPMQRGAMGPPKLMNMYSNQPQQFQLQHQLQEATSSFPSSPSNVVIPQMNHPSPQQMNQASNMSPQISSGPIHPMSGDVCPASPQLSSQTLGSVGSMSNSPMDLPSVNKTNSMNNS